MALTVSRRRFIKNTASAASFFIVPRHVLGKGFLAPSDIIQMGFIGNGKLSENLMKRFMETKQARIIAVADPYSVKTTRFIGWYTKFFTEKFPDQSLNTIKVHTQYLELLADKSVDAVAIATPDHWHAAMAIQAARHGKDIYGEKPLSLTVREGRAMIDAVRKYNRVFQTGSMQRSWPNFRKACELVRNGYIGNIKEVHVNVGNPPMPVDFEAEEIPVSLNWQEWLGPNDPHLYHHFLAPRLEDTFWAKWRYYKPFGGGNITDFGAHMFDIAHWGLKLDGTGPKNIIPPSSIPSTGPIRGLEMRYANGSIIKHIDTGNENSVRFIGDEGQIDISRSIFITPEKIKDITLKSSDEKLPVPESHYMDFLNSMRDRSRPICDIEIGHSTATVCNLANIAYDLKRPLQWNPKKEKFKGDKEANALLTRKHWEKHAGLAPL